MREVTDITQDIVSLGDKIEELTKKQNVLVSLLCMERKRTALLRKELEFLKINGRGDVEATILREVETIIASGKSCKCCMVGQEIDGNIVSTGDEPAFDGSVFDNNDVLMVSSPCKENIPSFRHGKSIDVEMLPPLHKNSISLKIEELENTIGIYSDLVMNNVSSQAVINEDNDSTLVVDINEGAHLIEVESTVKTMDLMKKFRSCKSPEKFHGAANTTSGKRNRKQSEQFGFAVPNDIYESQRRSNCRSCDGCLRPECQRCLYCKDKPKYGGLGIKKQKCIRRKCKFS